MVMQRAAKQLAECRNLYANNGASEILCSAPTGAARCQTCHCRHPYSPATFLLPTGLAVA